MRSSDMQKLISGYNLSVETQQQEKIATRINGDDNNHHYVEMLGLFYHSTQNNCYTVKALVNNGTNSLA